MKAIQRGIVALIAVCWALTGCGGEAEDTREDEFGQAELASATPPTPSYNVWPDNYRINYARTSQANPYMAARGDQAFIDATNMLLFTTQPETFPLFSGDKLLIYFSSGSNSDVLVSLSPLAAIPWEQVSPHYFHLVCFDATSGMPSQHPTYPPSLNRKRKSCTLNINTNAVSAKSIATGQSETVLVKAALCRALWFSASSAKPANTCGKADDSSFKSFTSSWVSNNDVFPFGSIPGMRANMQAIDSVSNPDVFLYAAELP